MTVRVWMKKDGEEKVWTPQTDEEAKDLIEEIKELAEDQTHEVVDPDNPPIR